MIKKFDEIKGQLKELAEIINSFKSEAVQMRLVELILGRGSDAPDEETPDNDIPPKPRKMKRRKSGAATADPVADGETAGVRRSRSAGGRPGPGEMIDRLLSEGFFKAGKTAAQIIEHCREKHAAPYKASDMSPTLVRALRAKKLERAKNTEGQFEYFKPKSSSQS